MRQRQSKTLKIVGVLPVRRRLPFSYLHNLQCPPMMNADSNNTKIAKPDRTFLFVYGTLKRGQPHDFYLFGAEFIAEARTPLATGYLTLAPIRAS